MLLVFPIIRPINSGPKALAFYMKKSINPVFFGKKINFYHTSYFNCTFPHFDFIWFQYKNPKICSSEQKIILGPTVAPLKWKLFPKRGTFEEKWDEFLGHYEYYAVHSTRVKSYMIDKTSNLHNKKYLIFPACCEKSNLSIQRVLSWKQRSIDILFFEKYSDFNYRILGNTIFTHLQKEYSCERLIYGKFRRDQMLNMAQNSKAVLYFSFYETGGIAIKEIQNCGVFAFVVQKDLIDNSNGIFLDNVSNIPKIINVIKKTFLLPKNSKELFRYNNKKHSCSNSLNFVEEQIFLNSQAHI